MPRLYNPLRAKAYQSTADLNFAYPQTEVKNHLTSLAVACGQQLLVSKPGLPLKISGYPYSSRCWVDTDPIHQGSKPEQLHVRQWVCLWATVADNKQGYKNQNINKIIAPEFKPRCVELELREALVVRFPIEEKYTGIAWYRCPPINVRSLNSDSSN